MGVNDTLFKGLRKKFFTKQVGAFLYTQTREGNAAIVGYTANEPNVEIPGMVDGKIVTEIGEGAFCNQNGVVYVNIPQTVTNIEKRAFENNENLLAVSLPSSVRSIAPEAFINCTSLLINVVPDSYCEKYCISNELDYSYEIDEGILSGFQTDELDDDEGIAILDYFYTKPEVQIPAMLNGKPVTTIGKKAFAGDEDIVKIIMPDTVTKIECYAFEACPHLEEIVFSKKLRIIGDAAFQFCDALTELNIPKSVEKIGKNAFHLCRKLEKVSLPNDIKVINKGTFSCCESLRTINVPDSVCGIYEKAFECCASLKSITLNGKLYQLGGDAFFGSGLESVNVPLAGEYGERIFSFSHQLKAATLPQGMKVVPSHMFSSCESLRSVSIPESVTEIEESAFPKEVTAFVVPGSYAEQYCQENGIQVSYINSTAMPHTLVSGNNVDENEEEDEFAASNPTRKALMRRLQKARSELYGLDDEEDDETTYYVDDDWHSSYTQEIKSSFDGITEFRDPEMKELFNVISDTWHAFIGVLAKENLQMYFKQGRAYLYMMYAVLAKLIDKVPNLSYYVSHFSTYSHASLLVKGDQNDTLREELTPYMNRYWSFEKQSGDMSRAMADYIYCINVEETQYERELADYVSAGQVGYLKQFIYVVGELEKKWLQ